MEIELSDKDVDALVALMEACEQFFEAPERYHFIKKHGWVRE